MLGGVSCLEIA
jgi:hypothetical protein